MARDVMYYFDKNDFVELGEVQQSFNVSLTLDGTKESAKYIILAYEDITITPFTIVRHLGRDWIVSHDKVSRYQNEQGFLYEHELQLLGLIELLNARDLTDCGYRSSRYTIKQFVERLFKLSNFEFPIVWQNGYFDITQTVDYVKTFENYTLLSALREFFDGYNCSVKGSLTKISGTWYFLLSVVPKEGYINSERLTLDYFNDVNEITNFDKNSYGSIVISNAENLVSPKSIRYPVVGTTTLKAFEHKLTKDNACLILPTPVYKANKLSLVAHNYIVYLRDKSDDSIIAILYPYSNPYDEVDFNRAFNSFVNNIETALGSAASEEIENEKDTIYDNLLKATTFEMYDGFLYDAQNEKFKYPKNAHYGMKLDHFYNYTQNTYRYVIFTDKTTRDGIAIPSGLSEINQGIYWERGSNLIRGFNYFDTVATNTSKRLAFTFSILGTNTLYEFSVGNANYEIIVLGCDFDPDTNGLTNIDLNGIHFDYRWLNCFIDYIPMVDIKIKTNNGVHKKDIQLYNQTGKLTDGVALSKLINSYSKQITDQEITRYGIYYDIQDVPFVGQIVEVGNINYIINNVSLDYYLNEIDYMIKGEFTMTRQIANKSLMVNADSNIRDYGIPQNYNVKRKEIYGNAFQVTYFATHRDTTDNNLRFSLKEALDMFSIPGQTYYSQFRYEPSEAIGYVAFIKCEADYATYDNSSDYPIGTTSAYYYKLDCTKYTLKHQAIIMVDFQDNNVIGYSNCNIASGFSFVWLDPRQTINTPVSYVDSVGEVEGISIQFVEESKVGDVYKDYVDSVGQTDVNLFNGVVFLDTDGEIYDLAYHYSDFEIVATDYNKDALEVPVFEVSYQLIGGDRVIVGEDIFNNHEGEDVVIMYGFKETTQYVNEHNALSLIDNELLASDGQFELENACEVKLQWNEGNFFIYPYTSIHYDSYEQKVYYEGTPTYTTTDFGGIEDDIEDSVYWDATPNGIYTNEFSEFFEDIDDVPEIYGITLTIVIGDNDHEQTFVVEGSIDFDDPSEWYVNVSGHLVALIRWSIDNFDYSGWDTGSLYHYIDEYAFRIRGEDTNIRFNSGKNIIVFRYICGKVSQEVEKTELVFVAKNVPSVSIQPSGQLLLQTNIYKLK